MCLDRLRLGRAARFDRIGIDGSLPENPMAVQQVPCDSMMRSCTRTNSSPMMWRLLLRIAHAAERREKLILRAIDLDSSPRPGRRTCDRTNSVSPSRIRPVST